MEYKLESLEGREFFPGYKGKMIHGQHLTLAFWEVEEGAIVPEHSHINEQIMQVLEGEFELTVSGKKAVYSRATWY